MASLNWSAEAHTSRPVVEIYTDKYYYGGDLTGITGVVFASGSNPITVTFFDKGNVDMAMRAIVQQLGDANAITGFFEDRVSGARWPS